MKFLFHGIPCRKNSEKWIHIYFTLIELLTVIAVIAILAALLFPALARAKATTQKVQCMNNLKQFNIATVNYSMENDDYLVPWAMYAIPSDNSDTSGRRYWWYTVYFTATGKKAKNQTMDTLGTIMLCPSVIYVQDNKRNFHQFNYCYGLNSTLCNKAANPLIWDVPRLSKIRNSGTRILYGDNHVGVIDGVWNSATDANGGKLSKTLGPIVRHGKGGNDVFVDGHVEWLPMAETYLSDVHYQ